MTNQKTNSPMITKEQFIASFSPDDKRKIADKIIADIYDRGVPRLKKIAPIQAERILRQSVSVAVLEHQNFAFVRKTTK